MSAEIQTKQPRGRIFPCRGAAFCILFSEIGFAPEGNLALAFFGFGELYFLNGLFRGDQDAVGNALIFVQVDEGDACGLHDAHGGGVAIISGGTRTGEAWADVFAPDDGISHFTAIREGDMIVTDMEVLAFDPIAAIEGDMGHIEITGMLDGKAILLQRFAVEMLEHPFCAEETVFEFLFTIIILIPEGTRNVKELIIGEGTLH